MPKKPVPYGGTAKKRKKKARPLPASAPAPGTALPMPPASAAIPRTPAPHPEARMPALAKVSSVLSFAAEQRYVTSDLKRIGVISGAMFAILIALALILG